VVSAASRICLAGTANLHELPNPAQVLVNNNNFIRFQNHVFKDSSGMYRTYQSPWLHTVPATLIISPNTRAILFNTIYLITPPVCTVLI